MADRGEIEKILRRQDEDLATIERMKASGDDVSSLVEAVMERSQRIDEMGDPDESAGAELKPGTDPRTDAANAMRFLRRNKTRVRCCWEYGGWLFWDGKRWKPDVQKVIVRRHMEEVARELAIEAERRYDELSSSMSGASKDEQKAIKEEMQEVGKLRTWARDSQQSARIGSSLRCAETAEGVVLEGSDLDAEPFLLNTRTGVLDLVTGAVHEHHPRRLVTRIANVEYDAKAEAPLWQAFLEQVLPDEEIRAWLQQWAGTCLTSDISDRVIVMLLGVGANGKGVFLDTLAHVLGDYAQSTSPDFFASSRGAAKSSLEYEAAQIKGARLLRASETERGANLNESMLKQISGGDPIMGRHPFSRPFTFQPECKLVLATNNRPRLRDTSKAVYDRLAPIDFPARFEKAEQDRGLKKALAEEAPGVLNWMIEGLRAWLDNGRRLMESEKVQEAVEEYRGDEDPMTGFFETEAVEGRRLRVDAQELWAQYETWAERERIQKPLGKIMFSKEMKRRGFKRIKSNGKRFWKGVALRGEDGNARYQDKLDQGVIEFGGAAPDPDDPQDY